MNGERFRALSANIMATGSLSVHGNHWPSTGRTTHSRSPCVHVFSGVIFAASMDATPPPRTIDDAEQAGWLGLELKQECCRRSTIVLPLPWLKARTKRQEIAEVARHLKCEHCGARPTSVGLVRQVNRGNGVPTTETVPL